MPTMFGFSISSDVKLMSLAFVIIISYLVIAEHCLSALDGACRETNYARAVQSLYKELVIMGISSFVLNMLIATNALDTDESRFLVYMDTADVTLFFSAVYHVSLAFALLLANIPKMKELREQFSEDIHTLVERYNKAPKYEKALWYPFSFVKSSVERRMLRIMFLKQFNLDRYLILAEEYHIMDMLEISPIYWGFFVALIAFNFLRVYYGASTESLRDSVRHMCTDKEHEKCVTATGQVLVFTIVIHVFLIVLIVMAVLSRLYTIRLLNINAPKDPNDYSVYMLEDEVSELEENMKATNRMTLDKVKATLQDLKKCEVIKELRRREAEGQKMRETIAVTKRRMRTMTNLVTSNMQKKVHTANSTSEQPAKSSNNPVRTENHRASNAARRSAVSNITQSVRVGAGILNNMGRRRTSEDSTLSNKMRIVYISYSGIQSGIFLFDKPNLYYATRDVCNLFLCLLLAFYSTTIVAVSLMTRNPIMWNILFVFDLLASIFLQAYIVHASSTINAVTHFQGEVVGKVIEEQEENLDIEKLIREKVIRKVKDYLGITTDNMNDSQLKKAVLQLFNELQSLDGQPDNLISKDELRVLLQKCNIFFSKSKLDIAFKLVDTDGSGAISVNEFNDFIFPSEANENRRKSRLLKLKAKGMWKKALYDVQEEGVTLDGGEGGVNKKNWSNMFQKKAKMVGAVASVFGTKKDNTVSKKLKRKMSVTKEAALIGTAVKATDCKLYNMMAAHRAALALKKSINQKRAEAKNTVGPIGAEEEKGDTVEILQLEEESNKGGTDVDLLELETDPQTNVVTSAAPAPPVNWTEKEYDDIRKSLESLKL